MLNKFGKKNFLISVVLVAVLSLLFTVICYVPIERMVIDRGKERFEFVLSEQVEKVENLLDMASRNSQLIYFDSDAYNSILNTKEDKSKNEGYERERQLMLFLYMLMNNNPNIVHSILIRPDTSVLYKTRDGDRILYRELIQFDDDIFDAIEGKEGKPYFFYRKVANGLRTYLTIGRQIKNIDTGEELGTLFLDVDIEQIFKKFSKSPTEGEILLTSEAGQEIISTSTLTDKDLAELLQTANGNAVRLNERKQYVFKKDIHSTGWNMYYYVDEALLLDMYRGMRNNTLLAIGGVFILGIVLYAIFSIHTSNRLNKLLDGMHELENGNFDVMVTDNSKDEIAQLMVGFNEMGAGIKQMMEREELLRLKQKEMEKSILLHQINPHFIYNTLESIQMHAILNEQRDIAKMVGSLGRLMRISLSDTDEIVTMSQEFDFIKDYLYMFKIRFGDRLKCQVRLEEELKTAQILKFLIQPVVENSILHGPGDEGKCINIEVKAEKHADMVRISVIDDGVGIPGNEMKTLLESFNESGPRTEHIGMKNVYDRLKLFYGKGKFSFNIESSEGTGTIVIMEIPIVFVSKS